MEVKRKENDPRLLGEIIIYSLGGRYCLQNVTNNSSTLYLTYIPGDFLYTEEDLPPGPGGTRVQWISPEEADTFLKRDTLHRVGLTAGMVTSFQEMIPYISSGKPK